jgi:hypothetical protein
MRLGAMVLMLALAGCQKVEYVGVDVAFDIDPQGRTTSAKCIASSGGTCQIDFRGPAAIRASLQPGEMRRFQGIVPGASVCIEPEAAALAKCEPVTLAAGYARIRRGRYNRMS